MKAIGMVFYTIILMLMLVILFVTGPFMIVYGILQHEIYIELAGVTISILVAIFIATEELKR